MEAGRDGSFLSHDPETANPDRRAVLGGLKAGKPDVTVTVPEIGPVLAVSLKGTKGGLGSLTGGLEETAGACTNLHMMYPALVYGFWHIVSVGEADGGAVVKRQRLVDGHDDGRDHALVGGGEPPVEIRRYHDALKRLSEREGLRDAPSGYEACGLTLVTCSGGREECAAYPDYPAPESVLDYNRMFKRLYAVYDRRFVQGTRALRGTTQRRMWHRESPLLEDAILRNDRFAELQPRVVRGRAVCPPLHAESGGQQDSPGRKSDVKTSRPDRDHCTERPCWADGFSRPVASAATALPPVA